MLIRPVQGTIVVLALPLVVTEEQALRPGLTVAGMLFSYACMLAKLTQGNSVRLALLLVMTPPRCSHGGGDRIALHSGPVHAGRPCMPGAAPGHEWGAGVVVWLTQFQGLGSARVKQMMRCWDWLYCDAGCVLRVMAFHIPSCD